MIGLWLEGQKHFADTVSEEMSINDELQVFKATKNWLDRYFEGKQPEIKIITT